MSNGDFINCGERNVQTMYRVSLKDICVKYEIEIGDSVEVFIKKVKKESN